MSEPIHGAPIEFGTGLLHVRLRVLLPLPAVTLQDDQGLHSPQLPSSEKEINSC